MNPEHRIDRRRFLRLGGWTIAWAVVVVACEDTDVPSARRAGRPQADGPSADTAILRTASSLEVVAISVYRDLLRSGVVAAAELFQRVSLLRDHHREHAALLHRLTEEAGGDPFTAPNPIVLAGAQPRVDAVTEESAALVLAAEIEAMLAESYQANVGTLEQARLRQGLMAVGAAEARHVGLLATIVGGSAAPTAFQTVDLAVAPGTGL
jgi:Ferritin-like domain